AQPGPGPEQGVGAALALAGGQATAARSNGLTPAPAPPSGLTNGLPRHRDVLSCRRNPASATGRWRVSSLPAGAGHPWRAAAMKITNEILEDYLNCKYKGHLKLAGESGTKSDYEAMATTARAAAREAAIARLVARFGEGDASWGNAITPTTLRKGA